MKKTSLSFSDEEMRNMAEMAAFVLSLLSVVRERSGVSESVMHAWHTLCAKILDTAHALPTLARHMEHNSELRHSFFTPRYIDNADYTQMLDDVRDDLFWAELVSNMAAHTLERTMQPEEFDALSDDERRARVSALEAALWQEVTQHGIDRLVFLQHDEGNHNYR